MSCTHTSPLLQRCLCFNGIRVLCSPHTSLSAFKAFAWKGSTGKAKQPPPPLKHPHSGLQRLHLQPIHMFVGQLCFRSSFLSVFFFSLVFLRPPLWHMEAPRLGVELELQLPAYTPATATPNLSYVCDLHNTHSNAGSLTCYARPGIEPETSWILVDFVNAGPQWELF